MRALACRFLGDETGAVAVVVALAFPFMLLAGVLAVDISNWNVHKRQLQIQADAGALAGAAAFQFPCTGTVETSVIHAGQQYAGDADFGTGRVNTFKDIPDSNHHVLYNSPTYYGGRTKSDPGAPTLTGHPCADTAFDLKVTETDVGAFFGNFIAKDIDATARAQLKEAAGIQGLMPLAVPDPSAVEGAWVQFVNESTGATIGAPVKADHVAATSNPALYTTTPQTVDVNTDKIGVRAIISGSATDNDCSHNGVACYDADGGTLVSVRRWPTTNPDTAAQKQPWVSDLRLAPGTSTKPCDAPYFADVPLSNTPCNMDVFVTVHFATGATGITSLASQDVTLGGVALTRPADTNPATSTNIWTGKVPVNTSSGPTVLDLTIDQHEGSVHGTQCKSNNNSNSPCTVKIADAQRVYGASALTSGPLALVQIDQISPAVTYANSISACSSSPCNHQFVVTLGISTLHVATGVNERPTVLRALFNQQNSSENQTLVCDPLHRNLVYELTNGCNAQFRIANPGECDGVSKMDSLPQPWPCVETKGGETPNAIEQAMTARILGGASTCDATTANHWSSYPNFSDTDKRIVPLFLTSFGAFEGSGKATVPIINFAEFYITGWTGQGTKGNPTQDCPSNDPVPTDSKGGYLVGHFIKRVIPDSSGDTGNDCNPTDLTPCTAVLTR
jgi:hypothetical protein